MPRFADPLPEPDVQLEGSPMNGTVATRVLVGFGWFRPRLTRQVCAGGLCVPGQAAGPTGDAP